jgi:serine/threonine-protein kinase RIO1
MKASVPEPSFSRLVHLLAEQALMAMGVPHPEMQEQPPANPSVARFYVDLLSILESKVQGNLTESESSELKNVLYQLRMQILDLQPAVTANNPQATRPQA